MHGGKFYWRMPSKSLEAILRQAQQGPPSARLRAVQQPRVCSARMLPIFHFKIYDMSDGKTNEG